MRIQAGAAGAVSIHSGSVVRETVITLKKGTKPKIHAPWSTLKQGEATTYGAIAHNAI